jgi:hypothetical protein
MSRFRPSLATVTLAALVLSGPATASILQIDKVNPSNPNGTGGYVQGTYGANDSFSGVGTAFTQEPQFGDITVSATLGRTGASGSNSLIYSFNLTSQANWTGEQARSTATMQLLFSATTVATLDITALSGRSGDQFRYAEVTGSALSIPSGSWNSLGAAGQFTNTFAAGTYTFVVEFFNNGGGPTGLTQLAGTWSFASSGGGGGGGVPLPGAAGLAACGLVGLSRRRRR